MTALTNPSDALKDCGDEHDWSEAGLCPVCGGTDDETCICEPEPALGRGYFVEETQPREGERNVSANRN
jgi:hypothetical protein